MENVMTKEITVRELVKRMKLHDELVEACRLAREELASDYKYAGVCIVLHKVLTKVYKGAVVTLFLILLLPSLSFAGDLSPNFSRSEFNQKNAPLPIEEVQVETSLINALERLRALIGGKPLIVHSGFRTAQYNNKIGGATRSQHLHGRAADISTPSLTPTELARYAKEAGFTFIKIYDNHLHVDVR